MFQEKVDSIIHKVSKNSLEGIIVVTFITDTSWVAWVALHC